MTEQAGFLLEIASLPSLLSTSLGVLRTRGGAAAAGPVQESTGTAQRPRGWGRAPSLAPAGAVPRALGRAAWRTAPCSLGARNGLAWPRSAEPLGGGRRLRERRAAARSVEEDRQRSV